MGLQLEWRGGGDDDGSHRNVAGEVEVLLSVHMCSGPAAGQDEALMMSKFGLLRGSKPQTKRRSLCEYPAEQGDTFVDEALQDCLDSGVFCI